MAVRYFCDECGSDNEVVHLSISAEIGEAHFNTGPSKSSHAARDRVWDWFTGTLSSRLDNKAQDAILVVMQRLHVDDLCGRLLERGGFELLSIPAIPDAAQELTIAEGRTLTRPAGSVLDPVREPAEVLQQTRREIGSANFEAQ